MARWAGRHLGGLVNLHLFIKPTLLIGSRRSQLLIQPRQVSKQRSQVGTNLGLVSQLNPLHQLLAIQPPGCCVRLQIVDGFGPFGIGEPLVRVKVAHPTYSKGSCCKSVS